MNGGTLLLSSAAMHWMTIAATLIALLVSAGCGACNSCGGESTGTSVGEAVSGGDPGEEERSTPEDPGEPPRVRIRGEPRPEGSVGIVVESRGENAAALSARLELQREVDGAWKLFGEAEGLSLRRSCAVSAESCLDLVPGAELRPPDWLGRKGPGQCACEECPEAPDGRYRFVVESCDGNHRVEGVPFALERP